MSGKKIAIMDNDQEWIGQAIKACKRTGIDKVDGYLYPNNYDKFIMNAPKYDILLVDLYLGGTNGANVVKALFRKAISSKLIVVSGIDDDKIKDFSFFINKNDFLKNPESILRMGGSKVEQAIETVMLLRWFGNAQQLSKANVSLVGVA
jgi:FixJ family two-component response regulator